MSTHRPTDVEVEILIARGKRLRAQALRGLVGQAWIAMTEVFRIPRAYRHL